MRKRIIAGNWKMYKTAEEAKNFAEEVKGKVPVSEQCRSGHLSTSTVSFRTCTKLQKVHSIGIGAQTMHDEKEGAFTGEVSPAMLAKYWCWLCHYWSLRTS